MENYMMKCPHCDLNYIPMNERACYVCTQRGSGTSISETMVALDAFADERKAIRNERQIAFDAFKAQRWDLKPKGY